MRQVDDGMFVLERRPARPIKASEIRAAGKTVASGRSSKTAAASALSQSNGRARSASASATSRTQKKR